MKTREGFVSNSSSASFVVKWRAKWPDNREGTVKESVARLFDETWGAYDPEKDTFKVWNMKTNQHVPFVRRKETPPEAFDGMNNEDLLAAIIERHDPSEDGPPAPGDYDKDWSPSDVRRAEMLHDLADATTKDDSGWLTTKFWTCMLNSPTDFGRIAQEFSIALLCAEDQYEHVVKVEDD